MAFHARPERKTKMRKVTVKNVDIRCKMVNGEDYICLSDIAKYKAEQPDALIANWLRNRNTIEFLGIWETLYNPHFNPLEFEGFRKQAGLNTFLLSPKKWVESTKAIGILSNSGRYGGTYAHKDIAFEFANWISVEFKLYFIKEFQRLKEQEQKQLGWSAKRELARINYRIHTDAIKETFSQPRSRRRKRAFLPGCISFWLAVFAPHLCGGGDTPRIRERQEALAWRNSNAANTIKVPKHLKSQVV